MSRPFRIRLIRNGRHHTSGPEHSRSRQGPPLEKFTQALCETAHSGVRAMTRERTMVRMGRAGLVVGMAIAALFLGGCGSDAYPGEPGATPRAVGTSSTTTTQAFGVGGGSGAPSHGPDFPLTLRRTGGIAGFDDRIVLEASGRVLVETRSVYGRVCTLGQAQQRQLVSLLATLRLGPVSTNDLPTGDFTPVDPGVAPESDPITISVTDDLAREIDLRDPSLGEIAGLVSSLVSDVTLSVPATTRCTTPTTPAASPPAP